MYGYVPFTADADGPPQQQDQLRGLPRWPCKLEPCIPHDSFPDPSQEKLGLPFEHAATQRDGSGLSPVALGRSMVMDFLVLGAARPL